MQDMKFRGKSVPGFTSQWGYILLLDFSSSLSVESVESKANYGKNSNRLRRNTEIKIAPYRMVHINFLSNYIAW